MSSSLKTKGLNRRKADFGDGDVGEMCIIDSCKDNKSYNDYKITTTNSISNNNNNNNEAAKGGSEDCDCYCPTPPATSPHDDNFSNSFCNGKAVVIPVTATAATATTHLYNNNINYNEQPMSILVGYAFGPKKMNTMGIIMAEASKASRYFTKEMFGIVTTTNNTMRGIGEASVVTNETFTGSSYSCEVLEEKMNDRYDEKHWLSRDLIDCLQRNVSAGDQAASPLSRTSISCAESYTSSISSRTALACGPGSNQQPSYSFSCRNRCNNIRVSFVPVDLDSPLEEQHGGNFDVILHKMTEDILMLSNNEGTGVRSESIERALERVKRLENYTADHNPTCYLVDTPAKIKTLMSREDIAVTLTRCLVGVSSRSGVSVRAPRFVVCGGKGDCNGAKVFISNANLANRIENAPFTYPLIAKPLQAAGTAESHKLAIVLGRKGLKRLQFPCILQEYSNHDAILFKVYVLGDEVFLFERPSLPNLPQGEKEIDVVGSYVEFDSQQPYPKLSDFVRTSHSAETEAGKEYLAASEPVFKRHKVSYSSSSQTYSFLSADEVAPVVSALRVAFDLDLFGFDVLVTSSEYSSGSMKELLVVDVNYFPSYKEVFNFPTLLAKYLTQQAINGRCRTGKIGHYR